MKNKVMLILSVCLLTLGIAACGKNPDAPEKRTAAQIAEFTGEITYDLPEGFHEEGKTEGVTYYVSEDYPDKGSNICYSNAENDNTFDVLSGSIYKKQVVSQLETAYDAEVEAEILEESFFEVDGRRGFTCTVKYTVGEETIIQIQCVIEDNKVFHFITYTEMNDEGFLEAFETSADSIRFE